MGSRFLSDWCSGDGLKTRFRNLSFNVSTNEEKTYILILTLLSEEEEPE